VQVYWADFIPFAHGMRLFGQFYNDAMRPRDPYEFMRLLEKSDLISVKRNRLLTEMAQLVAEDDTLRKRLTAGDEPPKGGAFENLIGEFIGHFGDLTCPVTTGGGQCRQGGEAVIKLVLELAGGSRPTPAGAVPRDDLEALEARFLDSFQGQRREHAAELLGLARNSYKLRDDDNIHLGRIETRLYAALQEARARLERSALSRARGGQRQRLETALAGFEPPGQGAPAVERSEPAAPRLKARQIVGQPAGPGLATGTARVVRRHEELFDFKQDEVLVCDAIDPNMTFIVPLVAAVVERRGGMLIHGAIIAREYGIPCVTGVTDATRLISTGDRVTVDGYLGLVTLGTHKL
jgi:pyruvate,water dikinase